MKLNKLENQNLISLINSLKENIKEAEQRENINQVVDLTNQLIGVRKVLKILGVNA